MFIKNVFRYLSTFENDISRVQNLFRVFIRIFYETLKFRNS